MFFFSRKKPKQFNYKSIYLRPDLNEEESTSEKMVNRWNRTSYADLVKTGNRRILYTIAVIALLIYGGITFYDYLIQRL